MHIFIQSYLFTASFAIAYNMLTLQLSSIAYAGPPMILVHPSGGDVPMNGNIILISRASGLGTLEYSWERNSGFSWIIVSNNNTTSYTTDTTLAIGQYMYRCRVSNEAGSVVSDIATVNVYGEYCPNM